MTNQLINCVHFEPQIWWQTNKITVIILNWTCIVSVLTQSRPQSVSVLTLSLNPKVFVLTQTQCALVLILTRSPFRWFRLQHCPLLFSNDAQGTLETIVSWDLSLTSHPKSSVPVRELLMLCSEYRVLPGKQHHFMTATWPGFKPMTFR